AEGRGVAPDTAIRANRLSRRERARPIMDWLVGAGRFVSDNNALVAQFCEQIVAADVPLARASVHVRTLHPPYGGPSRVWRRGMGVEESYLPHGVEKTSIFLSSPVHTVVKSGHMLDWRLDAHDRPPFPIFDELLDQGITHYVAAPLVYSDEAMSTVSWA